MQLTYTKSHVTGMMEKDKAKFTDIQSITDWFPHTPLGQQMKIDNIYDDGHYIIINVSVK